MKKKLIAVMSAVALSVAVLGVGGAVASDHGPDHMDLDFNGKSKKVANFPHKTHQEATGDCKTCHHKSKDGETPKACHSCHHKKKGDAPAIKNAYHKQCKGCHKKEKKGPTKCNDCHKRK